MATIALLLDWSSRVLVLLVVLLAVLFVAWQCLEGIFKLTDYGREWCHFIFNRRTFERWLKSLDDDEQAAKADKGQGE